MATVYLAHDIKHDRKVALKVLRPELSAALGAERFPREIKFVAQFNHPHILSLYDSGQAQGLLYYVMPYVEGESLRDRLAREKQLPIADAIRILKEVADALAYSHARGVVHRDIKPGNVLLNGRHAVVTDFGVAKAVIVIGLGVGGWLLSRGGGSSEKILRIGVMPIEDISKQDSMFVTALHAALTNALSKGGTVGVASFSEMMHFKGSTKTNKEIAAELKLDAIVEATVFRAGDVMRINVQLSNPVTTRNLWAETYNPNVKNVLAAQDSVVTKIEHGVDSVLAGPKKPGATP